MPSQVREPFAHQRSTPATAHSPRGSSACCGPACGAGSVSQNCAYPHCNSGTVCCNGPSTAGPTASLSEPGSACCASASDWCGGTCLEGIFAGGKCLNPSAGTFCFPPAGDICGSNCCEPNTPTCRINNGTTTLCCAADAGDICNDSTMCCPSGSPKCLNTTLCCGANDIVCSPTSTACCPPPRKLRGRRVLQSSIVRLGRPMLPLRRDVHARRMLRRVDVREHSLRRPLLQQRRHPPGATCSPTECCPANTPYCLFTNECSGECIPPK